MQGEGKICYNTLIKAREGFLDNKDKERTNKMEHKFNIGDRVVTNGATPHDNTVVLMPNRKGIVVGYDTDGKNKVMMDGEDMPCFVADYELNKDIH